MSLCRSNSISKNASYLDNWSEGRLSSNHPSHKWSNTHKIFHKYRLVLVKTSAIFYLLSPYLGNRYSGSTFLLASFLVLATHFSLWMDIFHQLIMNCSSNFRTTITNFIGKWWFHLLFWPTIWQNWCKMD